MRVAVLGSGSWGTALANLLSVNGASLPSEKAFSVSLWGRDRELAEQINSRRENPRYLPGLQLHPNLKATSDPAEALHNAVFCVLAVPCQSMRENLRALAPFFPDKIPLVCASKGIETATLKTMSGVVAEELPKARYAILSGPSFAAEVTAGLPCAVVIGCGQKKLGQKLRVAFSSEVFRAYSSEDVLGVELGGALKNVVAIAAGLADGLKLGSNARAALITRGLAEMSRLGAAMGAKSQTFMGLSGLGDLVLTCTGDLSRNRRVGLRLAEGLSVGAIVQDLHMVAEGVKTAEAVVKISRQTGVDMPVAETVYAVLQQKISLKKAVKQLMTRSLKEE